jgi:hypothetical protein
MVKPIDLRRYYTFGLSLLQLMALLGGTGLVLSAIYFYFC